MENVVNGLESAVVQYDYVRTGSVRLLDLLVFNCFAIYREETHFLNLGDGFTLYTELLEFIH